MLLASSLEPALMLEGMRAGVNEVLAEPLRQTDFDAAMTRLLGQRTQVLGGPVFAFVGAKGGVGTTTTAVNVATVLAKLSKGPTLLVDLHLAYGDAAVFLGADARFSLLDALENMHRLDAEFLKSLVVKTSSGLELLASADRPANRVVDMRRLGSVVQLAASQYAYTVLDVPRSDPAVLDSLDQRGESRHRGEPGARHRPQCRTHGGGAAVPVSERRRSRRSSTGAMARPRSASATSRRRSAARIAHQFPSDYRRR